MQRNNLPNSIENLSKIDPKTSFLRAPNLIAFLTRFWEHFGIILAGLRVHLPPFRLSWSLRRRLLGVCSAVLEPLGALQDLQTSILIDFGPVWSDPGAILDAQDPILDVQTSILEPQVPHLGGSDMILPTKPLSLSKPPSLQASKPPRPRRDARSGNN